MNTDIREWIEAIRENYPNVTPEQWAAAIAQNSSLVATIEALTEVKRLYTATR